MSCIKCEHARKAGHPEYVGCVKMSSPDTLMHEMRNHLQRLAEEGARVPLLVREPQTEDDYVEIINECFGYTGKSLGTGWVYAARPETENPGGMMYNDQFVVEKDGFCGLFEPRGGYKVSTPS